MANTCPSNVSICMINSCFSPPVEFLDFEVYVREYSSFFLEWSYSGTMNDASNIHRNFLMMELLIIEWNLQNNRSFNFEETGKTTNICRSFSLRMRNIGDAVRAKMTDVSLEFRSDFSVSESFNNEWENWSKILEKPEKWERLDLLLMFETKMLKKRRSICSDWICCWWWMSIDAIKCWRTCRDISPLDNWANFLRISLNCFSNFFFWNLF